MALLSLLDVSLSFGGPAVLEAVNLQIDPGERVCLVGRNGAGKSTLMRVIAGEMKPDRGDVFRPAGAVYTRLPQEIPTDIEGTVHDVVAGGLREAHVHEEEWERDVRLEDLFERLQLPLTKPFADLSGGLKRRALLGRALAGAPSLLLLDEPTNHLDIESILWLEKFLATEKLSLFFVTHDRAFLRNLATRIVELDRGRLSSWSCDYDTYLVRKQEVLEAEEKNAALFDKKLAQEEEWIRRGVRAQRSRATARINQLMQMRADRVARRERAGNVTMRLAEADRTGVKVIETENASFAFADGHTVVRDFTTTITRGDKIGLMGPNGAGKTTLIKLLLGQLSPTAGTVTHGTNLEIVYYDQLRAQIDDAKSVADNIADGNTTVTIDGRTRHVISYLQDFLFTPDRARTPARVLSGGERNRLLLARLFTKPANVLVLDEPTNDLDAETLDLLEDLLVEYQGTLLLVSHDREFLDNVVTSTFVFEGDGRIAEYVGGYADWQREKERQAVRALAAARATEAAEAAKAPAVPSADGPGKTARPRKLSFKEQRELEALPARIEAWEKEQAELTAKLVDPQFYQRGGAAVREIESRLAEIEREHATAFSRWETLETQRAAAAN
ncbi:ATP-binding cassette domain-containing protein [Horticoccus luteus]|uniref:ATP-binding protein Uup n=1 Tax=Horticoccus luteus TaxID=2862869 RepID=A0A8F9XG31_9BACT|nr:ATP-binding cassette domain-containing protein [Horticoccus luteus]QYM77785.1 ATP-binding cassette domain-containing protein [Horticoccus luteus]